MTSPPRGASSPDSSAEMETSLTRQAQALLLALGMGAGLGLLYDLLRPPRRRSAAALAAALDLLFGLAAGAAVFAFAMGAGDGRLGLWELTAALLGFLFYLHALSPAVLPLLELPYRVMENTMRSCKKIGEKLAVSAKKFFPNVREWIIMKR